MWVTKVIVTIVLIVVFALTTILAFTGAIELFGLSLEGNRTLWFIISIIVFIAFGLQRQFIIGELRWRLDEKRKLQQRLDRLAEYRSEAINKLYAKTPKKDEFTDWEKAYDSWSKNIENYFGDNFPYAIVEMFSDLGTVPSVNFSHVSKDPEIKDEHQHKLEMLVKELTIIETIIEKHSTVTFEEEPNFYEILKHVTREG